MSCISQCCRSLLCYCILYNYCLLLEHTKPSFLPLHPHSSQSWTRSSSSTSSSSRCPTRSAWAVSSSWEASPLPPCGMLLHSRAHVLAVSRMKACWFCCDVSSTLQTVLCIPDRHSVQKSRNAVLGVWVGLLSIMFHLSCKILIDFIHMLTT